MNDDCGFHSCASSGKCALCFSESLWDHWSRMNAVGMVFRKERPKYYETNLLLWDHILLVFFIVATRHFAFPSLLYAS